MSAVNQFLTILTIGVIGGIVYTLATHQGAISAAANGIDSLYKSATASTLGQVA